MSYQAVLAAPQSLEQKMNWSASAGLCSLVGRLVVQITIARMLGPEGVGRIAYLIWLIEMVNLLIGFGLPTSLTRYLAELHGQQRPDEAACFAQWLFVRYTFLLLVGSVAVGLLFFNSSHYVNLGAALPALVLLFFARGLENINQADLAGRQRFDLLARVNFVGTGILVAGVAVGIASLGVTGALYGYVAGAAVPAVYSLAILRGHSFRAKISRELRRRVWKFTCHTWLATLVSAFVWSRTEIYFLECYWDAREVAMFTVALTFPMMVRQVSTLFSGAFMAHFSNLNGHDRHELVQRQYETTLRLMALVVVPLALGGAGIMPAVIPLFFGSEFSVAVPNAIVLTATSTLALSGIGSALVYAKERSDFIAFGGIFGALLSIAAGFLIVSRFGAWGAVWTRLVVQFAMIAIGTRFVTTRLHFSYPFRHVGRTLLAGVLCGLSAWVVVEFLPSGVTTLGIAILVGAFVYALGLKLFRVLGREEVRQLKKITNRLPVSIHRPFALTLDVMASVR
ncbi:MAG: oligosaccharide flippase family protein [Thermoguttaceae bacterium]